MCLEMKDFLETIERIRIVESKTYLILYRRVVPESGRILKHSLYKHICRNLKEIKKIEYPYNILLP